MTTYYKAIRPDGTSFHDPSFRWVPESGTVEGIVVTHPHPHDRGPSGWLSVATVPTDCTGMRWPCRLLELTSVEGRPVTAPLKDLPNKRAASAWLVMRELPATDALGPQGAEVAAILDRVSRLTGDEARRLAAARNAARDAAGSSAWSAARAAAWGAVRAAARDAAGSSAWSAARDAARAAAWAALTRDLITTEQYDTLTAPWREVIGNA